MAGWVRRASDRGSVIRTARLLLPAALAIAGACSRQAEVDPEPANPDENESWLRSTCESETPVSERWPRYQLGRVSIAVPPEYRAGARLPHSITFRRGTAEMRFLLERELDTGFNVYYGPGTISCDAEYGGHATRVWAWQGRGQFRTMAQWQGLNDPDLRPLVTVIIRATRLRDAVLLRRALHTVTVLPVSGP